MADIELYDQTLVYRSAVVSDLCGKYNRAKHQSLIFFFFFLYCTLLEPSKSRSVVFIIQLMVNWSKHTFFLHTAQSRSHWNYVIRKKLVRSITSSENNLYTYFRRFAYIRNPGWIKPPRWWANLRGPAIQFILWDKGWQKETFEKWQTVHWNSRFFYFWSVYQFYEFTDSQKYLTTKQK